MRKRVLQFLLFLCPASIYSQVDLQTGYAVYQIPIFEHTDTRSGLSTGVNLFYNSQGGIKVSEIASNVGQNWNLAAGGHIQRIQNGEPDDQLQVENIPVENASQIYETKGDHNYAYNNWYPNGFRYSTTPLSEIPKEIALIPRFSSSEWSNKYRQSPRALADKEQDIFVFSFNGRSGEFSIGKDGSIAILDQSLLKVSVSGEFSTSEMTTGKIRTKIKSFTIIDEAGIEYLFSAIELTNLSYLKDKIKEGGDPGLSVSETDKHDKYFVTKWFISEIKNPFTGKKILFNYSDYTLDYLSNISADFQSILNSSFNPVAKTVNIIESRVFAKTKRLSEIIYPDNFKVVFQYTERLDIDNGGGLLLYSVDVYQSDKLFRSVDLKYKYFYKNEFTDAVVYYPSAYKKKFLRVGLSSFSTVNLDAPSKNLVYTFDYYTGSTSVQGDIVAPVNSIAQDAWGYYNGSSLIDDNLSGYDKFAIKQFLEGNFTTPSPHRDIFVGRAKNGLLKSIKLPTGGDLMYDYEQNNCIDGNGNYQTVGGVRVSQTTLKDNSANSPDIVTLYKYVESNGVTTSGWGYDKPSFMDQKFLLQRIDHSGFNIGGAAKDNLYIQSTINFITSVAKDAIMHAITNAVSKLIGIGSATAFSLVTAIETAGISLAMTLIMEFVVDTYKQFVIRTYKLFSKFQANPIPIRYARVEIYNNSLSVPNGKVVTEFSKPLNYNSEIISLDLDNPYSSKQRMESWKYYLPKKTYVYDKDNVLLTETESFCEFATSTLNDNHKSVKVDFASYYSDRYDWPVNNANEVLDGWFRFDYYNLKTGRSYITQTREKKYGKNGRVGETNTFYDYTGSTNYLPREIYSFNSKGEKVGRTIYYSSDYTILTDAMGELRAKNVLTLPITELSWYIPVGTSSKMYTGITTTEYATTPNGDIKPYKTYTAYNVSPVSASSIGSFNSSSIFISYPNTREVLTNTFDNNGNIVSSQAEGSQKVGYIYDYDYKYAVATVVNANPADISYTSFETDNTGGFSLSGTVYTDNRFAPTGRRQLLFTNELSYVERISLNPSETYIISYWSDKKQMDISGNLNFTEAITINGWTLYIHEMSGVSSIRISPHTEHGFSFAPTHIDELRLYPKNARMTTVCYDPVYGKIAEADANNRNTYYRYDRMGRLLMVQDQYRNALKVYEYNTKSN